MARATGEDMFMAREVYDQQLQVVAETRDRDMENGVCCGCCGGCEERYGLRR